MWRVDRSYSDAVQVSTQREARTRAHGNGNSDMRIAINAASAHEGGAVTYLRSILPPLHRKILDSGGGKIILWSKPSGPIDGVEQRDPGAAVNGAGLLGIGRRLWFDQHYLAKRLREDGVDALFSSANFATVRSPVHQLLLVRNTLYFDPLLFTRIPSRALRARYVAQRMLALKSIEASDVVLYPSRAIRDLVATYTNDSRGNWRVAPYGGRLDLFTPAAETSSVGEDRPRRLLHVSLYSDQKNLGTLFSAVSQLRPGAPKELQLRITAGLRNIRGGPSYPNLERERAAFLELQGRGIAEDVGPQPYASLPALYRSADVFVFPSYTESFGHPLIEAMATGLPIVAADTPVNREICDDAAVYFRPFDPTACASAIAAVLDSPATAAKLGSNGLSRSRSYTWDRHVDVLWDALYNSKR